MPICYAWAGLGGGTGTSVMRTMARAAGARGHSGRADCTTSGLARSRTSTIFSGPAEGMAGRRWPHVSLALLSARQIAHGLWGLNVSPAAAATDSVPA